MALWYVTVYMPYHAQARAAAALRERGAYVHTEPAGPAWLRKLVGEDYFVKVTDIPVIEGTLTDDDLVLLNALTNLEGLNLNGMQVTDGGVEHIKALTNLRDLKLEGTQVTNAGLEHIKGLRNLETLDLDRTRVTDTGLEYIKGMTSLWGLCLNETQVTDAGLEHIRGLRGLAALTLDGTQITDAGLGAYQQLEQSAVPGTQGYPDNRRRAGTREGAH